MLKHWQHTEVVAEKDYLAFLHHNVPLTPKVHIPNNTAVYVSSDKGSKPLEGIYDPVIKGIRQLRNKNAPNKDLRLYNDAISSEHMTIIAVDGLMGTGKTQTCITNIINKHLINAKSYEDYKANSGEHKILISKPAVNAGGEEYGFLPGDIDEKITPTLKNFTQYFDVLPQGFEGLKLSGRVEILPLGFIRGMNAEDMTIVVDECQNTKELVTVVTRKSSNSRIFLLGDTSPFQIDLKGNTPDKNGLTDIIDLLSGAPYFQYIEMKTLSHIVRGEEVRDIVRRLFRKYGEDPREWLV